jgi:hypothetical protein
MDLSFLPFLSFESLFECFLLIDVVTNGLVPTLTCLSDNVPNEESSNDQYVVIPGTHYEGKNKKWYVNS